MACNFLRKQWIDAMIQSLKLTNPELSGKEIREFVEAEYEKKYTEHDAKIYNSYENIVYNTTLGECVDWIQSFKPLIAESGVFFYPKHMKRNLNTEIIKECMLDARTIHKKEKFAALDAGDVFLANVKDIQQANDKKAANSGYGAEGQRSSFLFNMHSAMSVTSCGRGQLSTAAQGFENLFADYVKFFNMDEFYTWVNHIVNEQGEWKFKTNDVVDFIPSEKDWIRRFRRKFLHETFMVESDVRAVYRELSDDMKIRVYYKANMMEFFEDNFRPKQLLTKIMQTKCKFKKKNKDGSEKPHFFIDPNEVPDTIQGDLDLLTAILMEFVQYRYGVFRYEDRMRYQKRFGVPVSDTDSMFCCYQNQCKFLEDRVIPKTLGRKDGNSGFENRQMKHLKLINILSYITSAGIKDTL